MAKQEEENRGLREKLHTASKFGVVIGLIAQRSIITAIGILG